MGLPRPLGWIWADWFVVRWYFIFRLFASLVFIISMIARYAEREMHGRAMGLRVTLNQMIWFAVPVIMGFVAEIFGREDSFYVIGFTAIILLGLLTLWTYDRKIIHKLI